MSEEERGGVGTEWDRVALIAVVVPEAVEMSEIYPLSVLLHRRPTFLAVGLSLVPLGGPGLRVSGGTSVQGFRISVRRLWWFGVGSGVIRGGISCRINKLELRLYFQAQTVSAQKKSGMFFASVRSLFIFASVHASSW